MSDIDIVVLWVDGNDPEWQKEKAKYQGITYDDSNSVNRFRDWGLMKYWFRGIEKYMPWVRKIHFVTWGHLPSFLNCENPKLHIVRHEDYLPEYVRPTFNSRAIEMNIHRIDGLSDNFIYFNDDCFVLRPMRETEFFVNNLPVAYFAEVPTSFSGVLESWSHMYVNDLGIINKYFPKAKVRKTLGKKYYSTAFLRKDRIRTAFMYRLNPEKFTGFKNFHCPVGFKKSTFETIWEKEPELLKQTSSSKFRTPKDVNQWLPLWWQIVSGDFSPGFVETDVVAVNAVNVDTVYDSISKQKYSMICLNDPTDALDVDSLSAKLSAAFDQILPDKSLFEK